jgi:hypothetical protein
MVYNTLFYNNHWTTEIRPFYGALFHLRTETDPVSEMLFSIL